MSFWRSLQCVDPRPKVVTKTLPKIHFLLDVSDDSGNGPLESFMNIRIAYNFKNSKNTKYLRLVFFTL